MVLKNHDAKYNLKKTKKQIDITRRESIRIG